MKRFLAVATAVVCAGAVTVWTAAAMAFGTTQAASSISFNSATLNAAVQVGDTVHFQYGTGTLSSSSPSTTSETATSTNYSKTVTGLTTGTTYRFRIVTDDNTGGEQTFTTASAPEVSTGVADGVTTSSGRLTGSVDPNGAATTYRFEWGTSSSLGRMTATTSAGSGSSSVPVAATISGLTTNKRYYYRVSATNAAGTVKGSIRSFVTSKTLTGLTIAVQPGYVPYGRNATISGNLGGTGVGGVIVALEFQPFPYTDPFKELATAKTSGGGGYQMTYSALLINTRIRVVSRTSPAISSQVRTLFSRPLVGIIVRRGARRTTFRGTVTPAAPNGVVRVQRRSPRGKWVTVKRSRLSPFDANRSAYRIRVKRRRGTAYRVIVNPRDGGAHAAGYSRVRFVR